MKRKSQVTHEYHVPNVERVLTNSDIRQIAGNLRDDRAAPDDARMLLEQFVHGCYADDGPPSELLIYLRDAFSDFLYGGKSLQVALHLKKSRGRPKANRAMHVDMATELLHHRLEKDVSHEKAVDHVVEKFGYGRTVVTDAWGAYKNNALERLRSERPANDPWSPQQLEILTKTYQVGPLHGTGPEKHSE